MNLVDIFSLPSGQANPGHLLHVVFLSFPASVDSGFHLMYTFSILYSTIVRPRAGYTFFFFSCSVLRDLISNISRATSCCQATVFRRLTLSVMMRHRGCVDIIHKFTEYEDAFLLSLVCQGSFRVRIRICIRIFRTAQLYRIEDEPAIAVSTDLLQAPTFKKSVLDQQAQSYMRQEWRCAD